jgi:molecular chaperone DnaJ
LKFRRDGNSVLFNLPISFVQAALGDEVEVPTIDGNVKYTIPEGTQSGTVFRLREKGIPNLHGRGRGDQFITVNGLNAPKTFLRPPQESRFLRVNLPGRLTAKVPEVIKPKKKKHRKIKLCRGGAYVAAPACN